MQDQSTQKNIYAKAKKVTLVYMYGPEQNSSNDIIGQPLPPPPPLSNI